MRPEYPSQRRPTSHGRCDGRDAEQRGEPRRFAAVRTPMRRHLIDRFTLMIHPVVLGAGRRMFAGDGRLTELRLVDSITTTAGVVIATYEPR